MIEEAVEVVVRWLEEHGHHDLARAVSEATDPRTPEELAADAAQVKDMLMRHALGRA